MPKTAPAAPDGEPCGQIETIVAAYLAFSHGDARLALCCAVTDALSDLMAAERRARQRSRLISRGYVRGLLEERD